MKLYCVKFLNDGVITDVTHVLAKDDEEVNERMTKIILDGINNGSNICGYSFDTVDEVEGLDLHNLLKIYERRDGHIKVKDLM
jgi:hypothetical protein